MIHMAKKRYEDDDQRIIADMSSLESGLHRSEEPEQNTKSEEPPFTREERRLYALAALKAALLIGLAFLGGLGLVIWLITLL